VDGVRRAPKARDERRKAAPENLERLFVVQGSASCDGFATIAVHYFVAH
jgi:hypothetical protein